MSSDLLDIGELAVTIKASAQGRRRMMVGIDGPGEAGKSTLAAQLVEVLNDAFLVHSDDFYLPSARRNERLGEVGSSFDLPRLLDQVVLPGATGTALRYQRYDWTNDALTEWTDVPKGASIIVEGVYCLAGALRKFCTYKIWCRADPAVRLARGLERDGDVALSQWEGVWMPSEDDYAVKQKPDLASDLVLDSSFNQETGQAFRVVER